MLIGPNFHVILIPSGRTTYYVIIPINVVKTLAKMWCKNEKKNGAVYCYVRGENVKQK